METGVDFPGICVVFACHDGDGNFLFSKRTLKCRDEHGTWDPGGGKVEFGSTVESTLRREIYEEYRADILHFEMLGYRDVHRDQGSVRTHWIALDFKVLVDRSTVANGEQEKLEAIEWFKLDDLPSPMHSQWPRFLSLYKEKLLAPPRL